MTGRLTRARLVALLAGAALFAAFGIAVAIFVGRDASTGRLWILDLRRAFEPGTIDANTLTISRLPRAVAAALAGAGLAAAGVAFQATLRNPLAEPFTLGVSSGSALAAVLAIRFGLEATLGPIAIPLCAFAGAAASIAVVWSVSRVGHSRPPAMLLLAGVTVAFMCSAASMIAQTTASFTESNQIMRWMMGGLDVHDWRLLERSAAIIAAGLAVLLYLARDLNALAAGEDAAASVGVPVARTVRATYVAASIAVGAVVAFAGPVGFVGVLVPHTMRSLVGPDHRALLPASIFAGAGLVALSDTVARIALRGGELPVGVVTALLGGSFFLWRLLREQGRTLWF